MFAGLSTKITRRTATWMRPPCASRSAWCRQCAVPAATSRTPRLSAMAVARARSALAKWRRWTTRRSMSTFILCSPVEVEWCCAQLWCALLCNLVARCTTFHLWVHLHPFTCHLQSRLVARFMVFFVLLMLFFSWCSRMLLVQVVSTSQFHFIAYSKQV